MPLLRSPGTLPRHTAMLFSPWLLVGAALILALAIGFWAVKNTRQERENMARNLLERASALMWAMEGGARAGIGLQSAASYLQFMLEETARQPDIVYIAVLTQQGEVVAHSDRQRVGGRLPSLERMAGFAPFPQVSWRILESGGGRTRIFEAARLFSPLPGFRHHIGHDAATIQGLPEGMLRKTAPSRRGGKLLPPALSPALPDALSQDSDGSAAREAWPLAPGGALAPPAPPPLSEAVPLRPRKGGELVIAVGLAMAPYERALVAGERSTLFSAVLIGLLGLGGFLSLFWAQSYKMSRRMLLDATAFAEEVIGSLPLGLVVFDAGDKVARVNGVAEKLLGGSGDALLGLTPEEVQGAAWQKLAERVRRGENVPEEEHELVPRLADGTTGAPIPVSLGASRIGNEEGETLGMIYLLRDVREVKRLQAELRRSERLSTLGNMAARVAHEIRNPLSSIKGFATYLGSRHVHDADKEAARTMIGEVDRLNRVVSELLDFARPANLRIAHEDLEGLVRRAMRLADVDAAAKGVALVLEKQESGPAAVRVAVDGERITQALLNLLLNAVQATDRGGSVSVALLPPSGGRAGLTVTDTGRGMDEDVLARACTPYYTTKASGTGLGLSIVSRIVDEHRGEIALQSQAGRGTVVTVWLPRAETEPAGAPAHA